MSSQLKNMKQMNGGAMELIDKSQAIEIVQGKCK